MRRLASVLLPLCAACGFSFDAPSQVKDLRVLAIRVDPPELTPTFSGTISVRALVVDAQPVGTVPWTLSLCTVAPRLGTGSSARCPAGSATALLGLTTGLSAIGFTAPLPPAVLAVVHSKQAIAPQLQLELTVGEAPLYAEKAVTVTPLPNEGQAPNLNPVLSQLTFDGAPWTADAPLHVQAGSCTEDKKETITNADSTRSTFCTHDLVPSFDGSQQQFYLALSGTTGQLVSVQEKLRFAWFADQGVFHHDTTAQAGASNNPTAGGDVANVWREAAGVTGLVTFWVVVRDGRGGESWEVRQLLVQ